MTTQICLQCGERVEPRADGTCPSCRGPVAGTDSPTPTAGAPARSFSGPAPAEPVVPAANPYASPTADVSPFLNVAPGALGDAERARRYYLGHEASIQSIGSLYYLGAAITVIMLIVLVLGVPRGLEPGPLVILCGMIGLSVIFGRGLRALQPWVRIPVGIFAGIGLLGFPVGTLISAYILYLLFSRKGAMVFSPAYQDIIRQTPYIRYRTSKLAIGCLLLFLALVVFGIVSALLVPAMR